MNQMSRNCPPRNRMPDITMARSYQMYSRENGQSCPCSDAGASDTLESMNCSQLLQHINEVSFAFDDILLYLDTHPCDARALDYAEKMMNMRRSAMSVYARKFGPLTIDHTGERDSTTWEWVTQPWPWEPMQKKRGGCR